MKKIFTLFLGALVAVSLVAAPRVRTSSVLPKHVNKHVVEFTKKQALKKAPAALNGSTINITCDNLIEGEILGMYYVYGANDTYEVVAYLSPAEGATDLYGQYSSAAQNIMVAIYDANDEESEGIDLSDITATYSQTNEGLNSFVATGVDEAGNTYNIAMTGEPISEHEHEEDSDFSHTFATYTVDDSNLAEYGSVYVEAMDNEDYYLVLDITLPQGATSLVAGQYPILNDYDYQSVYAGYYDVTYGMIPSYAATLIDYMGQTYLEKVWYIVSGTITVNANGSITVAAKNSLDHDVTATLVAQAGDAVENVNADVKAVKSIKNGQIVIEHNGVKYNVLGTEMK